MTVATKTKTLDLTAVIATATKKIESLTARRERLGLEALRGRKGAEVEWAEIEAQIETQRKVFDQAAAAEVALEREDEASRSALSAREHAQLVAAREAAQTRLDETMAATDTALGVLVGVVQAAMQAGDAAYNAAIALGYNAGSQMATRDRLSARISHVLNLAGLGDFEFSLSPSGRSPLAGPAEPWKSNDVERPPLPNRRDTHKPFTPDDPGYPGALLSNRPVVKRELQAEDGSWVEVPVTQVELNG